MRGEAPRGAALRGRGGGRAGVLGVVVAAIVAAGCGPTWAPLVRAPETRGPALLIRDVGVLDVVVGRVLPARDVLVIGDRIVRIAATGGGDPPVPCTIVDGSGATLVPGLIDMHVHLAANGAPPWMRGNADVEAALRAFLFAGVTTVVDLGDLVPAAFERRAQVARGELPGPRIRAAGSMVTVRGGHPVPMLRATLPWWQRGYVLPRLVIEVDSPAAGVAAAARVAAMGADLLKVVVDRPEPDGPRIDAETLRATVGEARRLGLRSLAHVGTTVDAIDAAEAGAAAWAHGVYRERIPDAEIGTLAAFGIPMVATVEVFDSMARMGVEPWEPTALERAMVPPAILRALADVPPRYRAAFEQPSYERLRRERTHWLENVRRLHDAGVVMLAGSDTSPGVFPGAGLHRELHQLTRAGLSIVEAVRAATLYPARFLAAAHEPEFGLVEEGTRADLVLVEGDPLADLDALARIRAVVLDGMLLERAPL